MKLCNGTKIGQCIITRISAIKYDLGMGQVIFSLTVIWVSETAEHHFV